MNHHAKKNKAASYQNPRGFEKSKEKLALDQLEQAAEKSVLFAVRTSVGYNGRVDDDAPISGRFVSYDCDDFLHIKEKYDDDWWIGRVVSTDERLGFIPSPVKIEKIRTIQKSRPQRSTKGMNGDKNKKVPI